MKKIITLIILIAINANVYSQCIPNTNSLTFNGNSSYANIPVNPLLVFTNEITIEAWVNAAAFTTAVTPSANSIVCHHGWAYGEQGYVLRSGTTGGTTGLLNFNIAGTDTLGNHVGWRPVIGTTPLNVNTWYHVAGTYDGDTLKCYVNGSLDGVAAFKGSIYDSSAYNVRIGKLAYDAGGTRFWNGKIDEVRIWNRALTKAEIDSNRNRQIDPTMQTGLVGYWRFNEGSGNSITDLSGNNLGGSLTSTLWSTSVPFSNAGPVANITYSSGLGLLTVYPAAAHYQWYLNGGLLLNDTLQSWYPSQNGLYYVVVTAANGCTNTSTTINLTNVGINEVDGASAIFIVNNPANDIVTIQLGSNLMVDRIELMDINGKYLSQFEKVAANAFTLSCVSFNEGLYFVRVYTNQGIVIRKLMVVH